MWSRVKHMCCASTKKRKQAVNDDPPSPDGTFTPRSQTASPSPSPAEKAAFRKTSKEELEREDALFKKTATSSLGTPSRKSIFIEGDSLEPDAEGLPVTGSDSFACADLGTSSSTGFEIAKTRGKEYEPMKLAGTGSPGSHSALFCLTPDGHKEDYADYSAPKLKPVQSEKNASAESTDEPVGVATSTCQYAISHSSLSDLIPETAKEKEANKVSLETKVAQSCEDNRASNSDEPANAGTSSHRHTVSHSALFGLMPD